MASSSNNNISISGWLRKRPRISGHWSLRFVQLTTSGNLVVYSQDPNLEQDRVVVALLTMVIPKKVTVDAVYDRLVRVKRNTTKNETVFVIRVRFHDAVMITLGAATREEAEKWKHHIELASGNAKAEEPVKQDGEEEEEEAGGEAKMRMNRMSLMPESWKTDMDVNWTVIDELDGMVIESADTKNQYPSIRGKCEVRGTPAQVFSWVMNPASNQDDAFTTCRVLKQISPTSDIVYMQTKDVWLGPVQTGARDLVLLRYWRREDEDADFVVTWQSIEDASLKIGASTEGFTRGRIFSMSLHVTPIYQASGVSSLVRIHCHADPGGTLTYMPLPVLTSWLTPFITRVLGIDRALEARHTRKESVVELDQEDQQQQLPAPPQRAAASNGGDVFEVNDMKIGSWNHAEWMETPLGEPFMVRGKRYLTDRVKVATTHHMFHIVCADLNRVARSEFHCAARGDSPLAQIQERFPDRQVFVLSFILPGPPYYILAIYGVSKPNVFGREGEEDTAFGRAWTNFVEGNDKYRNSVFKMIARVTKGSYVVRKAVGETPTLLGQKIKTSYFVGKNYIEVDVDLNSSSQAGTITGIFKGYGEVSDMAILLEGHAENELPEEVLFSFRMTKPSLAGAAPLGEDPNPELAQARRDFAAARAKGLEE